MGSTIVTWRGARFDPRTRDMLEELARQVSGYVQPSQGSYSTSDPDSGGTHAGGGAVDIRCSILTDAQEAEVVLWGRRIGFAMWLRRESKSWPRHIHGIAIGCPDLSDEARGQVVDYRNGRDGLLGNGPDDGPDVPFTTWEQYSRDLDPITVTEETTMFVFVVGRNAYRILAGDRWVSITPEFADNLIDAGAKRVGVPQEDSDRLAKTLRTEIA